MIKTIQTWIYRIQNYENKMYSLEKSNIEYRKLQNEMKRLVSLLSGDTWKEGDNMMEAIEAYQQDKYLKEHAQDFLMIMTQNAPEVAAQELFEYFGLEVPDSTNIEIETAKKLYDLWNMAVSATAITAVFPDVKFDDLKEPQKQFFIEEVHKLWNK